MSSLSVIMRSRNGELEVQASPHNSEHSAHTSGDDSDAKESHDDLPRKKFKSTYYSRKEEIASLQSEQERLTQQLDGLQDQHKDRIGSTIGATLASHALLQQLTHQNDVFTAGARSLLNTTTSTNPLRTYLHLPKDELQRDIAIESMHEPHCRKVIEYLLERARFQDLRRTTHQSDISEDSSGDVWFTSFDVTPFGDLDCTLKQVFDQMVWLTRHQEFIMFDNLGVSSFLDVDTFVEDMPKSSQVRIVSTMFDNVVMEKNLVAMRSFNPEGTEFMPVPHALIALESIEHDDLYPYQPTTRARLDISCGMLLLSVPSVDGSRPVVSVVRCSFKKLHKPQCPITIQQVERLHDLIPRWGEVLCRSARSNLMASTINPQC